MDKERKAGGREMGEREQEWGIGKGFGEGKGHGEAEGKREREQGSRRLGQGEQGGQEGFDEEAARKVGGVTRRGTRRTFVSEAGGL